MNENVTVDESDKENARLAEAPRIGVLGTLGLVLAALILPPATLFVGFWNYPDVSKELSAAGIFGVGCLAGSVMALLLLLEFIRVPHDGNRGRWVNVAACALVGLLLAGGAGFFPWLPGSPRGAVICAALALSCVGLVVLFANRRSAGPPRQGVARALGRVSGLIALLCGVVLPAVSWETSRETILQPGFAVGGAFLCWLVVVLLTRGSIPTLIGCAYVLSSAIRLLNLPLDHAETELEAQGNAIQELNVVKMQLPALVKEVDELTLRLRFLRCLLPEELDLNGFESQLGHALRAVGAGKVEVGRLAISEKHRDLSAARISVGARAAIVKLALARQCRRAEVLDSEGGSSAQTVVRVFSMPAPPRPRPRRSSYGTGGIDYPWLVFDPLSWARIRQLRGYEERLTEGNVHLAGFENELRKVHELEWKRHLFQTLVNAIELLSSQSSSSIRVRRLVQDGEKWVAEVEPAGGADGPTFRREGDRLLDGVVKSVAKDHLLVLAKIQALRFDPAVTENILLRFSAPQTPPPITLGRETTRITRPLLKDGTPDYGAWLNEKYGAGVTSENNAAELIGAVPPFGGSSFWTGIDVPGGTWSRLRTQPWVEKDCAPCAARLKLNQGPLVAIGAATQRPRYFERIPEARRLWGEEPSLQGIHHAADALTSRGMLRVGGNDLEGAVGDALATQRLAFLMEQGPTLYYRTMSSLVRREGIPLLPAIASAPNLSLPLARRFLGILVALPPSPSPAEAFDVYERMRELNAVLLRRERSASRGAGGMVAEKWVDEGADPIVKLRYALPSESLDWDFALKAINREVDLVVAYLAAPPGPQRRRAAAMMEAERERLDAELASLKKDLGAQIESGAGDDQGMLQLLPAAQKIATTPEGPRRLTALLPRFGLVGPRQVMAFNDSQSKFRIGVMTVALAVHRLATGGFPARLEELGADLLPARLAASTPLPGYTLRYTRTPGVKGGPGTFAIIAVPQDYIVVGFRGFCVDSTGAIRHASDDAEPRLVDGVCDPALER